MATERQPGDELETRVKTDLAETQYRYGVIDPKNHAQYRVYTSAEMIAKADEFGINEVKGYSADGRESRITKTGDNWVRADGKKIEDIQAEIDKQSLADIVSRAQLRTKVGQTGDHNIDRKLALADASAFLRIQDAEQQKIAAAAITKNTQEHADYKAGLEAAFTGYIRNPPKISEVADRIYHLERGTTLEQSANEPAGEQSKVQEAAHVFTLRTGNREREFTDAKKAGAAYYTADPEKSPRPSVVHAEDNRGRIIASTEIHGQYEDGQTRFYKTLPDVMPIDKEFQAGYYEALEKGVRKHLRTLKTEAKQGREPPKQLDRRVADDLERLAGYDSEKAIKLWQKNTPDGMQTPTYLTEQAVSQESNPVSKGQKQVKNIIEFYDKAQEKTAPKAEQAAQVTAAANDQAQVGAYENHAIPERLASRYLRVKNQYYFQDKTLAFEDGGKQLKVETENVTVIKDAIAIAEDRNWQTIKVSGSDNFKQQVWREASLKGLEVVGYKPTQVEVAELEKAKAALEAKQQVAAPAPRDRDGMIVGTLLDHGADHYKHDPNQGKSYFVKLEVDGKEVTKWGADFKRAFKESQSKPEVGDKIIMESVGQQEVSIDTKERDANGNEVEGKKPVKKNTWRVEREDYQTALEDQAEAIRTGREIESNVIRQMPQVAEAITAAKLGEKIAEQAHQSGVIKTEDEKEALVYIIREGLASALEKGKKISAPEVREQGRQATIDANNVLNDQKPPVVTKEPVQQEMVR
jgi:hypothetical protein